MAPGQPEADLRSDCHYRVLGVDRSANDADIAKAYRRLALQHHPDKNPGDRQQAEDRFKKISKAYAVLTDSQQRREYDELRRGGQFYGHPRTGGLSDAQADALFQSVFGMAGAPQRSTFCFDQGAAKAAPGGKQVKMDDLLAGIFGNLGGPPPPRRAQPKPQPDSGPEPARTTAAQPGASGVRVELAAPAGTAVVVRGLEKAPAHNGKAGRIQSFDATRGRYTVVIEDQENTNLSLRPQNITQRCQVELADEGELNGKAGIITSYDEGTDQYMVLLQSPPSAVAVKRGKCMLRDGTCVVLSGLSQERYNSQMAKIVAVHSETERYSVRCQSGETIKVKFDKATC